MLALCFVSNCTETVTVSRAVHNLLTMLKSDCHDACTNRTSEKKKTKPHH